MLLFPIQTSPDIRFRNKVVLTFLQTINASINQTLVRYLKYKKALESSANSSTESASDLQRQLDELLICKK